MEGQKIIISLTTWKPRMGNIPVVLDTIFNQTKKPEKVVLNLATEERIPENVQNYLDYSGVEVYRVPDTKVYKKLIPTLRRYPNDCIISIDDDFLYPNTMIEDFWKMHLRFPGLPISGNKYEYMGLQCHCGCASLTKAEFFGEYLFMIDDELMANCPSDDIVYTFLSTKNHCPYLRTDQEYFDNLECYNPTVPYTEQNELENTLGKSFNYLTKRFGKIDLIDDFLSGYAEHDDNLGYLLKKSRENYRRIYKASYSYRVGHALLSPFSFMKKSKKK